MKRLFDELAKTEEGRETLDHWKALREILKSETPST